jgi:protein ImuA
MESLPDLLARQAHQIWTGRTPRPVGPVISTGYRGLDEAIGGGWPTGDLVEIMTFGGGLGRSTMLLPALATLTQAGKAIAWLPSEDEQPYAPTLQAAHVDLKRVLFTKTQDHHQRLWGTEQCLRSGACGAVVLTEIRNITLPQLRRLKLAAMAGSAIMFVLRTDAAAESPSPAGLRLRVRSAPYAISQREVTILKCNGHPPRSITLDLDARG